MESHSLRDAALQSELAEALHGQLRIRPVHPAVAAATLLALASDCLSHLAHLPNNVRAAHAALTEARRLLESGDTGGGD